MQLINDKKYALSELELKILRQVSLEGMSSERELAKKLRLNQKTVNHAFKKLKKEKIVLGFKYRINPACIGLKSSAWIYIRQKQGISLDDLLKKLSEIQECELALMLAGYYDFALRIQCKNQEHLLKTIYAIEQKFKDFIKTYNVSLISKTIKKHQMIVEEKIFEPDKNELLILKEKIENPEQKLNELAKKTGLHKNTVTKKWLDLINKKIVLKKSISINPMYFQEIGIDFKAIVFFDCEAGYSRQVATELAKIESVHELDLLSSDHDIIAIVRLENASAFKDFQKKVHSNEKAFKSVIATNSMILIDSISSSAMKSILSK